MILKFLQMLYDWTTLLDWEETARCVNCGEVRSKSRMVHRDFYGWFCSDEEFGAYWQDTQW